MRRTILSMAGVATVLAYAGLAAEVDAASLLHPKLQVDGQQCQHKSCFVLWSPAGLDPLGRQIWEKKCTRGDCPFSCEIVIAPGTATRRCKCIYPPPQPAVPGDNCCHGKWINDGDGGDPAGSGIQEPFCNPGCPASCGQTNSCVSSEDDITFDRCCLCTVD